ncbi:hypothetical protein Bca4012_039206 [Brassica carinata]
MKGYLTPCSGETHPPIFRSPVKGRKASGPTKPCENTDLDQRFLLTLNASASKSFSVSLALLLLLLLAVLPFQLPLLRFSPYVG